MQVKTSQKKLDYNRKWKLENPDKVKIHKKRYCQKHREQISQQQKKWQESHKEQQKQYRLKNREKRREQTRIWYAKNKDKRTEWRRRRVLTLNGKSIGGLNKRPYTGYCEICLKTLDELKQKRLGYHHWDDNNPSLGIWVCNRCHRICEVAEHGDLPKLRKYIELREKLKNDQTRQV